MSRFSTFQSTPRVTAEGFRNSIGSANTSCKVGTIFSLDRSLEETAHHNASTDAELHTLTIPTPARRRTQDIVLYGLSCCLFWPKLANHSVMEWQTSDSLVPGSGSNAAISQHNVSNTTSAVVRRASLSRIFLG